MQFRALGTGTTAVQDGPLLGLETALSFHADGGSQLPGAPAGSKEHPERWGQCLSADGPLRR